MCVMVFLSIKGIQEFIHLCALGYSLNVSIKPTLLSFSDTKEVKLLWQTSSPWTFHPNIIKSIIIFKVKSKQQINCDLYK